MIEKPGNRVAATPLLVRRKLVVTQQPELLCEIRGCDFLSVNFCKRCKQPRFTSRSDKPARISNSQQHVFSDGVIVVQRPRKRKTLLQASSKSIFWRGIHVMTCKGKCKYNHYHSLHACASLC